MNKLTKDNFEKIFENFKKEIDMSAGVSVVRVVIDAIFDKALGEHFFTDIYADLCHRFAEKFAFFQQQFLKTKQCYDCLIELYFCMKMFFCEMT